MNDLSGTILGQYRLMQDRDVVAVGEQFGELAEQAGADQHRVRRVDGHLDGDRWDAFDHGVT